jgi:hypothetical protein
VPPPDASAGDDTSSAAPSSGRGSDLIAHQTTQQRYRIGIFMMTIRKISSHTVG